MKFPALIGPTGDARAENGQYQSAAWVKASFSFSFFSFFGSNFFHFSAIADFPLAFFLSEKRCSNTWDALLYIICFMTFFMICDRWPVACDLWPANCDLQPVTCYLQKKPVARPCSGCPSRGWLMTDALFTRSYKYVDLHTISEEILPLVELHRIRKKCGVNDNKIKR